MKSNKKSDLALKVTDFGFSRVFNPKQGLTEILGSPIYMAPEIVNKQTYGPPVDIWAAGVLLFILIANEPPFHAHSKKEVFHLIQT